MASTDTPAAPRPNGFHATPRLLLVNNEKAMGSLLSHLETEGWRVVVVAGQQDLAALQADGFDVIVTEVSRPFRRAQPQLNGATQRALNAPPPRAEDRRMREEAEEPAGSDNIIVGHSKVMKRLFEQIGAIAGSEAAVLLLGESGTGKELVARAIHRRSNRRDRPFVAVNCAAIPDQLLESELFGHEKGAFTGADRRHRGLFAEADGGTLLLDEVGDLPPRLQGKLLRALQEHAIRPVGGTQDVHLDLRVIAATHRDLPELVEDGRFREDLYYRLAVLPIRLPSLRERPEDIILLATHFLSRSGSLAGKILDGFDDEATDWLLEHRWPGNVRELENVIERAAALASGPRVTRADLGVEFVADGLTGTTHPTLPVIEYRYMRRVLAETKGDKRAAARILGVSVRTLQRKLKKGVDDNLSPRRQTCRRRSATPPEDLHSERAA